MLDQVDQRLVELLQRNARLSNAEMAEAVGLTASSVFERVKKLEQRGVITGYVAKVNPVMVGKPLLAFMRLTSGVTEAGALKSVEKDITGLAASEPDILECHDVAGEDCLILKLRAADPRELQSLLGKIRECYQSSKTVTSIVLETLKESSAVSPAGEEAVDR